MIFNDDFNKLVFALCDINEEICKHFFKMKEKIPHKYFRQLKALSQINCNEDIYYIYLNHNHPSCCKDEIEFVFGMGGWCYHLVLRNHNAQSSPNYEFNNKANLFGCKLKFESGYYLGEYEICDDINIKKIRYHFQLRQTDGEQFIDLLKVCCAKSEINAVEVSYNKIYNDDLLLK